MLDFTVTFAITIVNLTILFFILRAILFKPVTKFMNNRTAKIRNDIDSAEKDRIAAKALLEQYADKLKTAHAEAEAIIKQAQEQADALSTMRLEETKREAEVIIANARKQIEAEQKAVALLFKTEAARLVIAASSRLLQREVNAEDSRHLVDRSVEELGNRFIVTKH
ncbi:MAG: F0F1 ATP synthase subunit B [Treponema sp.]|jgi:F-type H+-transporting ATPase subunit b|nr:F0F1 ATP synthase subunit B [Treponema sp.]